MTDSEQLLHYIETRRGEDLAPLVKRHVDWVHACAQRQLHGDAHLAADVTQAVFLALAQNPPKLKDDGAVVGWLFGVTRYACFRAIRDESRRRRHESQAAMMRNETVKEATEMDEASWNQIAPMLDQFVAKLSESDRRSVILRFFQQRSYLELGEAMGISEEAARKRVSRAVEKLRQMLAAKGVTAPAAALSAGMLAHTTYPAPAAVITAVSSTTPIGAAATMIAKGVNTMMAIAHLKTAAITALLALLVPMAGVFLFAQIANPSRPAPAPPITQVVDQNLPLPSGITEGSATVLVTDDQGQPVVGAEVYAVQLVRPPDDDLDAAAITHVGPVLTDGSGMARIGPLGPLKTEIGWQQFFYARTNSHEAGLVQRAYFRDSTVPPVNDPVPVKVVKSPAINGTVKLPQGFEPKTVSIRLAFISVPALSPQQGQEPIFENCLKQFQQNWPGLFRTSVGDDGTFRLIDVPGQGEVTLLASGQGLGAAQARLNIGAGGAPAELKMQPQAVIAGRVKFEDSGQPAAQIPVVLHQHDGASLNQSIEALTDSAGRFRFEGLTEGNYTAYAEIRRLPEWTMMVLPAVRVAPGQVIDSFDMKLEHGVVVTGKAESSTTRKPLSRAEIVAISPADDPNSQITRSGWTDDQGKFSIRLPHGDSKLYLMRAGKGYMPPPKQGQRTISIAADGTVKGDLYFNAVPDLREQGFATIQGTLVDTAGKPIAGARIADDRVEMWDSDPMPVQDPSAATTDSEGKFHFSAQAGIKHKLFISSPDYKGDQSSEFIPHANETVTMNLIGVQLPITAWISGEVLDPTGMPIEGAEVRIFRDTIQTDADGKFRLPQRLGDEGRVSVFKRAYGVRDWLSVVPNDNGEDLKFILYPTGQRPRRTERPRPMDSRLVLDFPAPALQVESWVRLAGQKSPPPSVDAGRKTLLMFTATYDNHHRYAGTIKDWLAKLDQNAAKLDAQAIVIFTPFTHESGIRALLKDMKFQATVGVDQFVPLADYYDGATRASYGGEGTTRVFLIRADGIVASDDFDLEKGK